MNMRTRFSSNVLAMIVLIVPISGYSSGASAAIDLSQQPIYVASSVEPNLMFNLDDSGSMQWETLPEELTVLFWDGDSNHRWQRIYHMYPYTADLYGGSGYWGSSGPSNTGTANRTIPTFGDPVIDAKNKTAGLFRSAYTNPQYYNPKVRYRPWVNSDGTLMDNASATAALLNPMDSTKGSLNLTGEQTLSAVWYDDTTTTPPDGNADTSSRTARPATYYVFNENDTTCVESFNLGSGNIPPSSCYTKVEIRSDVGSYTHGGPGRTDCAAPLSCTYEEELQNFANWFQYHRSRILSARAGVGRAFVNVPEKMRIGFTTINDTGAPVLPLASFDSTQRSNFYTQLYSRDIGSSITPLRRSMGEVGEYFQESTTWTEECQASYHILMTDGYWTEGNSYDADESGAHLNVDGTDDPTHTSNSGEEFSYVAESPFNDSYSNTLADTAMYYWKNDLQPNLANRVPTNDLNPAFWQHLVTYGVGLGVAGSVDAEEAFNAIGDATTTITWPDPTSSNSAKIDDLLHAAVNTRGGFFSSSNPESFATELSLMLNSIIETVGTSTGVTFNTASLETDTLLFGARFNSARWSGELFAFALTENESGPPTISESESWEASALLDARDLNSDPRQIITFNGSVGVPFAWNSLTEAQKNDLRTGGDDSLAQDRINYLRGSEIVGMRTRDSRLGDIVHSTPVYVGTPSLGWPNVEPFGVAGNHYADFRAEQQSRNPVVYVGANDGMLHAFAAHSGNTAGSELFGFIPSFIYSDQANEGLHYLTESGYQHRFYNDLSPVVSDAYIAGPGAAAEDWRTVLIGGARAGAKGIFALDITNPTSFGENNADDLVLWEFSSEDDARMGFIVDPPSVGLAKWGNNDYRWTAFFGNGYNSTTPATGIFMLDLEGGLDGTWTANSDYRFVSFETSVGASGASAVRQLDLNGDRIIDRLYVGDLNGKMWVASVSNNGSWSSPYSSGGNPTPLFTAVHTNVPQPITAAPMVVTNPDEGESNPFPDLLVLFGTGQYLTLDDPDNTAVQSFYGVLDSGNSALDRSDLVARTLSQSSITVEGISYQVRESDGDDILTEDGWYVDFNSLTDAGERITQSPQVRGEYVFVNSIVPSDNPCDVGGGGWLMAFGLDGKTPDRAVWPKLGAPYVGYRTEGGLPNRPGFLGDFMFTPRSDNEILADEIDVGRKETSLGRMSWQELYD